MTKLDEIRARLDAAAPGKWYTGHFASVRTENRIRLCNMEGGQANAEFVANAPEDIRYLLNRIAELEAERDAAVKYVTRCCTTCANTGDGAKCPGVKCSCGTHEYWQWRGIQREGDAE